MGLKKPECSKMMLIQNGNNILSDQFLFQPSLTSQASLLCSKEFTCRSFWGFQSESKIIHVSAAVKLMPKPPALVHRRKTKRSESGLLNRSMAACLRLPRTRPSIRSYKYLKNATDTHTHKEGLEQISCLHIYSLQCIKVISTNFDYQRVT